MRMILYLIFSLLLFSCSKKDSDYNYDGNNLKRNTYDILERDRGHYSNKYTTRFSIDAGPNIYRFYDEVFETICYTNSNGGMQCFKLSKSEWELLREQEIKEVQDAKTRKHSNN